MYVFGNRIKEWEIPYGEKDLRVLFDDDLFLEK